MGTIGERIGIRGRRDILDANATPTPAGEADHVLLELIGVGTKPAFRFERVRVGEDSRVVVVDVVREGDAGLFQAFLALQYW
jgi:hypothetical protein